MCGLAVNYSCTVNSSRVMLILCTCKSVTALFYVLIIFTELYKFLPTSFLHTEQNFQPV